MQTAAVLVTRATFPDIADRLREHFAVSDNPPDTVWSPTELIARLQGKQGVMSTGSERIDATLLDACPELKAVCNVGVGYNNVDVLRARPRRAPAGSTRQPCSKRPITSCSCCLTRPRRTTRSVRPSWRR